MPDGGHKGSFVQGYNAQIAVDGEAQVIVAAEVTQQSNDKQQLVAMVEQVKQNVGAQPQAVSADNGYWNGKQVGEVQVRGINLHVATGKQKPGASQQAEDEDGQESNAEGCSSFAFLNSISPRGRSDSLISARVATTPLSS